LFYLLPEIDKRDLSAVFDTSYVDFDEDYVSSHVGRVVVEWIL